MIFFIPKHSRLLVCSGMAFCILCLLLSMFTALSYASNQLKDEEWLPQWKQLTLEGEKPLTRFLVKLTIDDGASLCPYPLNDIKLDDFRCPWPQEGVLLLSAETVTMSLVLPQEKYEHFVWFRPENIKALQRVRWKKSGNKWLKLYVWQNKGVSRLSIRPREGEEILSPAKWTKRYRSFYRYPLEVVRKTGKIVSEPLSLIYLVSHLAHNGIKEKVSILVFGKKCLHAVTVSFKKEKSSQIRFHESSPHGFVKKKKKTSSYIYRIQAQSVVDGRYQETFSLIGLQHHIEIFVEPKSGIITRIRGDNDVVGHVDLRLVYVFKR